MQQRLLLLFYFFVSSFSIVLAQTPESEALYTAAYKAGIEAIDKKDYTGAILQFQKAVKANPNNNEAALRLVQCALMRQDLAAFQLGIETLSKNQYKGLNADIYLAFGQLAKSKKEFSLAIDAAQKGRIYDQNNAELLLLEAAVYKEQGHLLTAIQRLEQAAITGSNPIIYNELGNTYTEKGDLNKAIEYYNKTLSLEEDNPAALVCLGKIYIELYQQKGTNADAMLQKAIVTFEKYLEFYPMDNSSKDILTHLKRSKTGK